MIVIDERRDAYRALPYGPPAYLSCVHVDGANQQSERTLRVHVASGPARSARAISADGWSVDVHDGERRDRLHIAISYVYCHCEYIRQPDRRRDR